MIIFPLHLTLFRPALWRWSIFFKEPKNRQFPTAYRCSSL